MRLTCGLRDQGHGHLALHERVETAPDQKPHDEQKDGDHAVVPNRHNGGEKVSGAHEGLHPEPRFPRVQDGEEDLAQIIGILQGLFTFGQLWVVKSSALAATLLILDRNMTPSRLKTESMARRPPNHLGTCLICLQRPNSRCPSSQSSGYRPPQAPPHHLAPRPRPPRRVLLRSKGRS